MASSAVIDLLLQNIDQNIKVDFEKSSLRTWGRSLTSMPTITRPDKKVVNNKFQL